MKQNNKHLIDSIIRVDHAGEYGAARIYEGQLAVLKGTKSGNEIQKMLDQEKKHLDTFNKLIIDRNVRPSMLSPLWNLGGFLLGASTALLGPRSAMACTVAVESVIKDHYTKQLIKLGKNDKELSKIIEDFKKDEEDHELHAISHGAKKAKGYKYLSKGIKKMTKIAIKVAERI